MKILILGVNGFIGHSLAQRILATTDWKISGLDIASHKVEEFLDHPRFHYHKGDIAINRRWVADQIEKCDVVLPLIAIATPATYVKKPLAVFKLDFEENLRITRLCVRFKKRIIFPSTSEVYGMCPDAKFDEETSLLVYGPINKQRWIYSASKQLLDRVIYAYGQVEGLRFTLFRPFNWVGPHLDNVHDPKEGSSRVLTQFLHNILYRENIKLVDGGHQRRSFTYISDGIDCLMKIIKNEKGCAEGQIFNIGNPANDVSVRVLAKKLIAAVKKYPGFETIDRKVRIISVNSSQYYGKGYQDMKARVPSIQKAKERLGWAPKVSLDTAIVRTLDFYLKRKKLSLKSIPRD